MEKVVTTACAYYGEGCYNWKGRNRYAAYDISESYLCFGDAIDEVRESCIELPVNAQMLYKVGISSNIDKDWEGDFKQRNQMRISAFG